jgi:hypothetical protein
MTCRARDWRLVRAKKDPQLGEFDLTNSALESNLSAFAVEFVGLLR